MSKIDFNFHNHGSVTILVPVTPAAHEWVNDNLPTDTTRFNGEVVIEPRYADNILIGIHQNGLRLA